MNLSKNHIFLTSRFDIESIIKPLNKYNITYFAYVRSHDDGSRICFTNRSDDLEAYILKKHYLQGNCEAKPKLYQQQAVLWFSLPNQHLYQFSRINFNIDHGITLIRPTKRYCEFFAFASDINHPNVINFYLNNLDFLQDFSVYFKEEAKSLIKIGVKNKIYFPFHQQTIKPSTKIEMDDSNCPTYQGNKHLKYKLTHRQLDCAKYLLKGMKYHEIATKLHLSVRTVETHMEYLKDKLGCRNKTELILKLSK